MHSCTWGYADIDGAMALAEEITAYNAGASVTLYSDTDYIDKNNVSVKKIRDINDYNAAILDVRAVNVENYYRFEIDVACYGRNSDLRVYLDISGVNESLDKLPTITADVRCVDGEVVTLCFGKALEDETDIKIIEDLSVTEFSNVYVHIDEADSLERDNSFYLYGGRQETLRIQYKSETPNKYVRTALLVLRNQLKYRWDIEFVELMPDEEAATEGFDLYIY